MCNLSLAVISLLAILASTSNITSGIFNASQSIYQFNYTTTTSSSYINFQLYLSPSYSAALLIGKAFHFNVSVNRQDWIHFYHLGDHSCDYEGMVTGRNQYAYAGNNGSGSIIYFKLINFQPVHSFSFSINITEGNIFLQDCPSGYVQEIGGQYCQFCDFGHTGQYCSIARHYVQPSSQMTLSLSPFSYTYVLLQSQADFALNFIFDSGLMVFFQKQSFSDELAGVTNYLSSASGQGKFIYTKPMTVSMDLSASSGNILMGIINPNTTNIGFSIVFSEKSTGNVVLIIVGIIGGIVFIALIVAAMIIMRRLSNNQREVLPQGVHSGLNERLRSNKMSNEEINFYFPEAPMKILSFPLEESSFYFKQEQNEQTQKTECVICLCAIQDYQNIRVGYCRHVFHSACLIQWFKKQQNCPYCRQSFDRDSTRQMYKRLNEKAGKRLKKQEILRNIISKSTQMTVNTLQITDISGQACDL